MSAPPGVDPATLQALRAQIEAEIKAEIARESLESALQTMREVKLDETHEKAWYGAFNALLNSVFPNSEGYTVKPQWASVPSKVAVDFAVLSPFVIYVIEKKHRPILFLEIKPYPSLEWDDTRAEADEQMRKRFNAFVERCPIVTLYGLSFMGPIFAVYSANTRTRVRLPKKIKPDDDWMTDTAPREWWEYNLLDNQGVAKFRGVVEHIKAMEMALTNGLWQPDNHDMKSDLSDLPQDAAGP